jgi:uncharacterized integral membrane protein
MSAPPQQPLKQSTAKAPRQRSRQETARTATLVVVGILATLFAVFNAKDVQVNWIVGSGKAPLIIVIVISLLAGIVIAYLADRLQRKRRR